MSPYSEGYRQFESEMLQAEFYGAILLAIKERKKSQRLTQDELAKRMGKDKSTTSKLLAKARNWKLSTVADLAISLDLALEFAFVDKTNRLCKFTPTGVEPNNNIGLRNDEHQTPCLQLGVMPVVLSLPTNLGSVANVCPQFMPNVVPSVMIQPSNTLSSLANQVLNANAINL